MPVVTFDAKDLCQLIGKDFDAETLSERMPMMGGDLDKLDGDAITIEWFPDRPDLLTSEGTARALRAFLDVNPGLPTYTVGDATAELTVDESVQEVRPYAALCFVRDIPFDAEYLQQVIDAQEKLTLAPGRKRKKIAIGIHDAAGITGPFTYTVIGPDDKPFEPLAWEGELTPAQIMDQHPKGQEYAHLLPEGKYSVFLDGNGEVLSLPPVINAAKTTVTAATRDLLLDVTGVDPASVRQTIALLATGFVDRGGRIEAVTVHDASGTWVCPDLATHEHVLDVQKVQKWLGIDIDADTMAACMQRMGHGAEGFDNKVLVQSPSWRFDLLHEVDLMEDIAVGYGFENFEGELPRRITFGGDLDHQKRENDLRTAMLGHGYFEARTLTLSNDEDQWTKWGANPADHAPVRVANSALEDQTILRTWLTPSLLGTLAANRHRPLPQRIFEIGYAVEMDGEGIPRNRLRFAAVEQAAKTGFSEIKGLVEAIARDVNLDLKLAPGSQAGFIAGREGHILAGDTVVGHFGELHPDTIVAFGLGAATVAVEIDLSALPN